MSVKEKLNAITNPLTRIDLKSSWEDVPAPPRFVLETYIPAQVVTLLAGHGGTGKSNLALTICAHVAAGKSFAECAVDPCAVAFVSLEDNPELVHVRLSRIVAEYNLNADAVLDRLTLIDGSYSDAGLSVSNDHGVRPSTVFKDLEALVKGHGLIVVDNASDAFTGNENARAEVRQFMRLLGGLARDNDAAVVLLAHIDKASAKYGAQGNAYSGSTAWHNSARSRLALVYEDEWLLLTHEKCNLGPLGGAIRLTYSARGVPVPIPGLSQQADDFTDLIPAIRAAGNAGQTVYNNVNPGNYSAMSVLENFDELPQRYRGKSGRKLAARGITKLLSEKKLIVDTYTRANRKRGERIVVAPVVSLEAVK